MDYQSSRDEGHSIKIVWQLKKMKFTKHFFKIKH